eukprot:NODE_140_length_16098_cov_0.678605.p13 type:complete len:169 gc:universal NODE_140_length_16098_cov_0.678605:5712-6218(+)
MGKFFQSRHFKTLLVTMYKHRVWKIFNAENEILGRFATRLSLALQGKGKPYYSHQEDFGDYVVVINANKIKVTGRKEDQKVYYRHTMWPGGLKETKYKDTPKTSVVQMAVRRMLPKNNLRNGRMNRLFVFENDNHPYDGNILKYNNDVLDELNTQQINYVRNFLGASK